MKQHNDVIKKAKRGKMKHKELIINEVRLLGIVGFKPTTKFHGLHPLD